MIRTAFALLLLLATAIAGAARVHDNRRILSELDRHIDRIDEYQRRNDSVIGRARQHIADDKAGEIYLIVGDLYRKNNVDSAMRYYNRGMKRAAASDRDNYYRLKLALSSLAPVAGMVKEGIDMFESVPYDSIAPADRARYHEAANDLYTYTAVNYTNDSLRSYYYRLANEAARRLIGHLPPGAVKRRFFEAQLGLWNGGSDEALASMIELLDSVPVTSNLYARGCADIASYYAMKGGRDDECIHFLALSATSDVVSGTREASSLHQLGDALYRAGDLEHAYRYTSTALDLAVKGHVRMRTAESAQTVPMIAKAYRDSSDAHARRLYALTMLLLVITVALLVLLGYSLRERRRLRRMREHLAAVSELKSVYIRRVLTICGIYLDVLEDFRRLARRKLKAAQYNDLYSILEEGRFIRESTEQACAVFDEAFLSVYPSFVDDLNALLRPEARYAPLTEPKLGSELRIAAFIRLGIDSAEKMAKFMGLSVTSVYTYRNKMRSRAVDRDNFEQNVVEIGL